MRTGWAILILALAGIISYGNTARNGLFWDDDEFIKKNAFIRSFSQAPNWFSRPLTAGAGVNSNYYRPLLLASFTLDYQLWGLWPAGYHLENLLWHIAAGILLYIFLTTLLTDRAILNETKPVILGITSNSKTIALTASLLWLVHPVHTEAVAYANSRGDSLAAVFILLSLTLWLNHRFWASAAAFAAALLSKEFAIVTPGLILLIETLSHRSHRSLRNFPWKFRKLLPHFIVASVYILLRLTVLNFQNTLNFYGSGTQRLDFRNPFERYAASLPVRLMTFAKVLPIYAKILVWPNNLHMERRVEIAATISGPIVLMSLAGLSIVILLACYPSGLKRKPVFLFAAAWFFIAILPVSGIIPISQILAEHFLYLPSMGVFLLAGWIIMKTGLILSRRIANTNVSKHFISADKAINLGLAAVIAVPLLFKTVSQNRVWRDPITFYEYTLVHAPPTARVYNNLAMAYADAGEHQKAINNYQLAISLGDTYPHPHYNLANTLVEAGKSDEAEKEYRRALEIDPSFHYAILKLGQMYLDQEKVGEAKKLVCPAFPTQPLCRF